MKNLNETHKAIINLFGTKSNEEIAKELGLTKFQVAGYVAQLKRYGHIVEPSFKPIKSRKKKTTKKKKTNIAKLMNSSNENKTQARQYIINAILLSLNHIGKILSLPCDNWFIERSILEDVSNKFNILGVELDNKVYKRSGIKLFKNPILYNNCSLINGTIGEQIYKSKENEYAHLVLDYCGGFSSYAKEITFAMREKIVQVGGTISLTFSERALGDYGRAILETFGQNNEYKNIAVFEKFIDSFNTISESHYTIQTTYRYVGGENGKKGDNMVLFILKRIN